MEHFLASWGYVALVGVTALAALGIPVGSEIAIGYAGVLSSGAVIAGAHHHLNLVLVIIFAALGEVIGSLIGYAIGHLGGRAFVDRVGKYFLLTKRDLDRAEGWFERRGDPVVFFGRFIPLVRSFVSIAAGVGEMPLAKFIAYSAAASVIWCGLLAGIGYGLSSSWHRVLTDFSYVGYLAAAVVIVVVVIFFVHRIRQLRLERSQSE
ncbi:MAG TPA: DedA family protein [Acidimicrobiales bacterium]|jgi:membrane protein DedA with SNARE-associated domain